MFNRFKNIKIPLNIRIEVANEFFRYFLFIIILEFVFTVIISSFLNGILHVIFALYDELLETLILFIVLYPVNQFLFKENKKVKYVIFLLSGAIICLGYLSVAWYYRFKGYGS